MSGKRLSLGMVAAALGVSAPVGGLFGEVPLSQSPPKFYVEEDCPCSGLGMGLRFKPGGRSQTKVPSGWLSCGYLAVGSKRGTAQASFRITYYARGKDLDRRFPYDVRSNYRNRIEWYRKDKWQVRTDKETADRYGYMARNKARDTADGPMHCRGERVLRDSRGFIVTILANGTGAKNCGELKGTLDRLEQHALALIAKRAVPARQAPSKKMVLTLEHYHPLSVEVLAGKSQTYKGGDLVATVRDRKGGVSGKKVIFYVDPPREGSGGVLMPFVSKNPGGAAILAELKDSERLAKVLLRRRPGSAKEDITSNRWRTWYIGTSKTNASGVAVFNYTRARNNTGSAVAELKKWGVARGTIKAAVLNDSGDDFACEGSVAAEFDCIAAIGEIRAAPTPMAPDKVEQVHVMFDAESRKQRSNKRWNPRNLGMRSVRPGDLPFGLFPGDSVLLDETDEVVLGWFSGLRVFIKPKPGSLPQIGSEEEADTYRWIKFTVGFQGQAWGQSLPNWLRENQYDVITCSAASVPALIWGIVRSPWKVAGPIGTGLVVLTQLGAVGVQKYVPDRSPIVVELKSSLLLDMDKDKTALYTLEGRGKLHDIETGRTVEVMAGHKVDVSRSGKFGAVSEFGPEELSPELVTALNWMHSPPEGVVADRGAAAPVREPGDDAGVAGGKSSVGVRGADPAGMTREGTGVRPGAARPGEKRTFAGMEFAWIPPGRFVMGSPSDEPFRQKDEAQHEVTLTKGFWLGVCEVTKGQWKRIMGKGPWNVGPLKGLKNVPAGPDTPAQGVSWAEVESFVRRLNGRGEGRFRLPTEAEWEYACRAGTRTAYTWGNDPQAGKGWLNAGDRETGKVLARWGRFSWSDGYGYMAPVGQFKPNGWGLHDMQGNVSEWCGDWHGKYPSGAVVDPTGPSTGMSRIARGGFWISGPRNCRSADRCRIYPDKRFSHIGFRLVRER